MNTYDIVIEVRFKTTIEGGRENNIVGNFYGCPLFIDGEAFECRIPLDGKIIELGETYILPVKFMNLDMVLPKISIEKNIILWEGKDIANGKIICLNL